MFVLRRLFLRFNVCPVPSTSYPIHFSSSVSVQIRNFAPPHRLTDRFNQHIIALNNSRTTANSSLLLDGIRRLPTNIPKDAHTINQFDQQSCSQIEHLSHDDLLVLLHSWSSILQHQFHRLRIYAPAIEQLCLSYRSSQPARDFLTICHMLGAGKKRGQSPVLLDAFIRRHLNKYASSMSTIELAIVATAAFRTAIRLQPNHGQLFERTLVQMMDDAAAAADNDEPLDVALLVAFVKTLRLSRIRSDNVRRRLSEWMRSGRLEKNAQLQFRGLAHLFTFYADNRFVDAPAVRWMSEQAMRMIRADYAACQSERNPSDMRAKDFAMVLWSWAQLGEQPPGAADDLRLVCTILKKKLAHGVYERDFDGLVDATLSLWMCGLRSRALVNAVLDTERPAPAASRVKLDTRRRLLQTCVEVECPEWLGADTLLAHKHSAAIEPKRPARDYLLKKTPNLLHVQDLLRKSNPVSMNATLVQPIRDLNIPGLLVDGMTGAPSTLMVEVAEEHTTLDDGCTPFGLLALKMRLLRAHQHRVVLVNPGVQKDADILAHIQRGGG